MKHSEIRLGDPATHFWLTRSAARAMGVNLSEAMAMGKLSPQGYGQMVTACRACAVVESCTQWLATEAVRQSAAFAGCRNKAALESLQ